MDLISVIVPAYNCPRYIEACLRSVLGQSYPHLEVIVVNDGADPTTVEILLQTARSDGRVKILNQTHSGAGSARNLALDNANGEYVMFVDADDILAHDAIETLHKIALATGADVVKADYYAFDDGGRRRKSIFKSRWPAKKEVTSEEALRLMLLQRFSSSACWKLFKRVVIGEDARFGKGMTFNEDFHFLWLLYHKPIRIFLYPYPIYGYRQHDDSVTSGFDLRHLEVLPYLDSLRVRNREESKLIVTYKNSRIAHLAYTMRRAGAHKLYPRDFQKLCSHLRRSLRDFVFNPYYNLRDRVKAFLMMFQGW